MVVEFAVSAGLYFREVEVVNFDDDTTIEVIQANYDNWLLDNIDGGWRRVNESKEY